MENWEKEVEDAVYKIVSLTPLNNEEVRDLLNRVMARIEALPTIMVIPIDDDTAIAIPIEK